MKFNIKKYFNDFDTKTLITLLMLIVIVCGIFGWVYEYIFYFFNGGMKEFYWRGSNFIPWINVYAIGAVVIYLLCYKLKNKPWLVFILSVLSTGIIEYIGGYGLDKMAGIRCWDYRKEILTFGNINGYVCTRSVLVFGVFGLLLIYLFIPLFIKLIKSKYSNLVFKITVLLFSIIMFDELYNLVFARVLSLPRASSIYRKLGLKYVVF